MVTVRGPGSLFHGAPSFFLTSCEGLSLSLSLLEEENSLVALSTGLPYMCVCVWCVCVYTCSSLFIFIFIFFFFSLIHSVRWRCPHIYTHLHTYIRESSYYSLFCFSLSLSFYCTHTHTVESRQQWQVVTAARFVLSSFLCRRRNELCSPPSSPLSPPHPLRRSRRIQRVPRRWRLQRAHCTPPRKVHRMDGHQWRLLPPHTMYAPHFFRCSGHVPSPLWWCSARGKCSSSV